MLGPRLFILYMADLEDNVAEHGVSFHAFALCRRHAAICPLLSRPNQNKPYRYDVTDDDDLRKLSRNNYSLERPLNFYFLTFCGVIYQHSLRRRVYIAVSSYKLLFINFVKNRCISLLKAKATTSKSKTKAKARLPTKPFNNWSSF